MKRISRLGGVLLLSALFAGPVLAQMSTPKGAVIDIGKGEYEAACAVCHGMKAKGDGPFVSQLTTKVPDLTVLAKNNQGVFPFDRVYQVIDGRQEVKAHGLRDMPVWGRAFGRQSSIYFDNYPPQDAESQARSRILALTEYLYRLQAK